MTRKIHLFHVIEAGDFLSGFLDSKDHIVKATLQAVKMTNKLKSDYLKGEVDSVVKVETGKPYKKILEYAEAIDPSIIILGDNDPLDQKVKVLGSTNTNIITRSKWPVITVKNRKPASIRKIVLPIDLSTMFTAKICNAMMMAQEYNSKIYLVSVLMGGIKIEDSRIFSRMKEVQETFAKNNVESEIKLYDRTDVPVYKKILEYSNEIEADMIMILTHQESNTHDNYIGAVAHQIINEAPMPVMSLTYAAAVKELENFIKTAVDPFNIFTKNR